MREIIEKRLKELSAGPVALARQAGLDPNYIRDYLTGRKKTFRQDKIPALAKALGVDISYLITGKRAEGLIPDERGIRQVKVIGKVAAGSWREGDSHSDLGYVPAGGRFPAENQFGLIVEGTSLNKIARDGDRLVCVDTLKTGLAADPGDLVIVRRSKFNGLMFEFTAKRLHKTADGYELWPESDDPAWQEPIKIDSLHNGETDEICIIGKVLWILRKP